MKLTNKQKKALFDNGYITAKVLDAAVEPGWKDYFINYFDWELDTKHPVEGGWLAISIISKEYGNEVRYDTELNPSVLEIL